MHAQTCIECKKVIDPIKLGIIIEEAEENKRKTKELEERVQRLESMNRGLESDKRAKDLHLKSGVFGYQGTPDPYMNNLVEEERRRRE